MRASNRWLISCGIIILIITATLFKAHRDKQSKPLDIRAVGEGFYWTFHYPGEDQMIGTQDDVISEKKLIIPFGNTINLSLTSNDYIYIFHPENYPYREVAVPDIEFQLHFSISEIGSSKLMIDPLCGFNFLHDNDFMGSLEVKSKNEFRTWYKNASQMSL